MRNKKFSILTGSIMVFIFVQSALPADLSSAESGVIVDWILKVMEGILPVGREEIVFAVRKGAHFTEYMILGCSLMPAVKEWIGPTAGKEWTGPKAGKEWIGSKAAEDRKETGSLLKKNCLYAWLAGTGYAVTDELHQSFVPGRSCELRDMVIDSCGVLTGVAVAALAAWLMARRTRRSGSQGEP